MYNTLLVVHSLLRWLVLLSLLSSIAIAAKGMANHKDFTQSVNTLRHWTATICHTQLLTGIWLYTQSPYIKHYLSDNGTNNGDPFYFSVLHPVLMFIAITLVTIGSAKAKRKQ